MSEGKQGLLKSPTKIARVTTSTTKAGGSASSAASTANSNSTSSLLSTVAAASGHAHTTNPNNTTHNSDSAVASTSSTAGLGGGGGGGVGGDDDFKVNERVLLNGNKPAVIAFIGEIESKEGVWAGLILDEAGEGKNNGSLNGVVYFSTEENRGVFCRLSKLTKQVDSPPATTAAAAVAKQPQQDAAPR